jgi:RimJ/RimL family protein N-acetyltransferase
MTPRLTDTPVLETERLVLRAPAPQDYDVWVPFAMSRRAQFIGGPYSEAKAWRAFGHMIGHWTMRGFGLFVLTLKDSGQAIGAAGPWYPADWPEKEIGWTLWSSEAEGKGYAYEAALAARDHAYRTLGWTQAVSYIDAPNARSIALAERLGAKQDDTAQTIDTEDAKKVLVYRHPRAEDL